MPKKFMTTLEARDPRDPKRRVYSYMGPLIEADSFKEAENIAYTTGLGYCQVVGVFIKDIEDGKSSIATLYYNRDRDN